MSALENEQLSADAALPDPELVQETYERMRASVMAADRRLERDKQEAQEMLDAAVREQQQLRARYPVFFPEETARAGHHRGNPDAATINKMLRTLAEHPNQTRKQLERRLSWSGSWISRIIQYTNQQNGDLIAYGKHGRTRSYFLTEAGRQILDRGGVRGA